MANELRDMVRELNNEVTQAKGTQTLLTVWNGSQDAVDKHKGEQVDEGDFVHYAKKKLSGLKRPDDEESEDADQKQAKQREEKF